MLLDPHAFASMATGENVPPARPHRISTDERLMKALREISGPYTELVAHTETPWASITFSGVRHKYVLRFAGTEAVSDGENFIAVLPDHEFRLRGRLVADASVTRVDHEVVPAPLMEVECEILLLDED